MGVRTKIINIGCAKGFIDKTPIFMNERSKILDAVDRIYKIHGAEKLETPVFEIKEIFSNKRNANNKILDLEDQGGEILAMRYDLKHPLTRYLSMHKIEKHMKISQSGYVYSNENIDLGNFRLREFFVSDFDICGPTDPMVSETQCIRIGCDIIKALNLNEPVKVLIGHKKLTESLLRLVTNINESQAVKFINKLSDDTIKGKINWEKAEKSISDKKITDSVLKSLQQFIQSFNGDMETVVTKLEGNEQLNGLKELKPVILDLIQLKELCKSFLSEVDYKNLYFDFNLVGSRNFYTGLVYAFRLETNGMNILSGGRYENLITKINPKIKFKSACTGFSIGIDQLVMYKLLKLGLSNEIPIPTKQEANSGGDIVGTVGKSLKTIKIDNDNEPKEMGVDDLLKMAKGTIDRSPQQMEIREKVFKTIIGCFRRHNADTIDTPVIERQDVLTGKYGEDSKLIYDLNDVDNEKLSLRYDLTVPFARYLAMHEQLFANDSQFKRYQIGKVYRRDSPSISRGRYREFYQCDFDIAGSSRDLMQSDYECLNIVYEVLRDINLGNYRIKVNHRQFLDGLLNVCGVPDNLFRTICSSIDKLDKTPWDKVQEEMVLKGLPVDVADKIGEYVSYSGGIELVDKLESDEFLMKNGHIKAALVELRILFGKCVKIMDKIQFDLSLARGLDYYTGMIFEAVFVGFESKPQEENEASVGSVSGGGRYDNLVNMFSASDKVIPCVGLSIGVERLMAIYEKTQMPLNYGYKNQVMVINAQKNMIHERFQLLSMLLDAGITATHSMKKNPKALDVFQECERMKIPLAVMIGEDELKEDSVKLRFIDSRKEEMVPRSEIIKRLKSELNLIN